MAQSSVSPLVSVQVRAAQAAVGSAPASEGAALQADPAAASTDGMTGMQPPDGAVPGSDRAPKQEAGVGEQSLASKLACDSRQRHRLGPMGAFAE